MIGVVTGSVVPEHYDPLIAKVVALGPTRDAARASLIEALHETVVLGIATNRERLIQILKANRSGPAFLFIIITSSSS